jgi:hypothetical protein
MLVIIRDRIKDMVARKMTLDQIKAANPRSTTRALRGRHRAVDHGDVHRGDLQGSDQDRGAGAASAGAR